MDDLARQLTETGFAIAPGPFTTREAAFAAAFDAIATAAAPDALAVIGDFVLPPAEGDVSRAFQTLHLDFGVPVDPQIPRDVARYTALYVEHGSAPTTAITRLVPLAAVLGRRRWPELAVLIDRLRSYGRTRGAWDDADGYQEGSLARIVEAASGEAPDLPSVKADPAFLCGTEFAMIAAETAFLRRHGVDTEAEQVDLRLAPGELLLFDNLSVAHGRRGARRPGELRQRVFGHPGLDLAGQRALRDRFLGAFAAAPRSAVG